ncbi:MAG: ABC transporter substrate-binding protein [Proteobacteria bacterium]|nr:ABC transporter substrate-binding protein [Pseudomonadota bacterium]
MRHLRTAVAALLLLVAGTAAAEPTRLRSATQLGLTNLPPMIMEHERLVEKHARANGLGEIEVTWARLGAGEAFNDALLSGTIDFATVSVPTFLVSWDKTRGNYNIKGLGAFNALPLYLLVRDPKIQSIKDFTDKDRIALPGVQSSSHAIILEMEAERVWGEGQARRLDALTVSRAHPDAVAAFLSGSEITAHFSAPPFQQRELETPGVRKILSSRDVYGGPGTIGMVTALGRFCDANPKSCRSFLDALTDAVALIAADKRRAAEIYLAVSKVKDTVEQVQALLEAPDAVFDVTPRGTIKVAEFMHRIGTIKHRPESWRDLFFPFIHDRSGS